MNYNILDSVPVKDRELGIVKFREPKVSEFNRHTHAQIRRELRLIFQGLEIHGYPVKKLNHREVWRIGRADDLYLFSYQFDPLSWVLFPYHDNIAAIIAHSLHHHVTQIADTRSQIPF